MLLELKVQDFAIIDSVQIAFKPGLNILSGETGAGKSVLLKSLALLMGEKAVAEAVRNGSEQAVIEGLFDLSLRPDIEAKLGEMGLEVEDHQLIVRRVVSANGKNRIYMNGNLMALSSLKDIVSPLVEVAGHAAPLIEMTGQHESRHLLSKSYHLDILDHYAGSFGLRLEYQTHFERLREIANEIQRIHEESRTRAQRLDFLTFQRDEIKTLQLIPGEEQEIEMKVKRLKNAARLEEFVSMAERELYSADDSALVRLYAVIQKSEELRMVDENLPARIEGLTQAKTLIEECIYDLRSYSRELDADPSMLEEWQSRLSDIRRLQKKYGPTIEDILAALAKIEIEIEGLETSESTLKSLEAEQTQIRKLIEKQADDLHTRRKQAAKLLIAGVNEELAELNMKGVSFDIQIEELEECGPNGRTDIEFMTRSSSKDLPRPLAKFASGGELSRILLSMKRVVGHSDQPRTYLFDEVDTGVSGPTAEKVGKKLKSIAKGQQVICITHLPQVAACADAHYLLQKTSSKKGVQTDIIELSAKERVQEIARLISGTKITSSSIEHAKQLLGH